MSAITTPSSEGKKFEKNDIITTLFNFDCNEDCLITSVSALYDIKWSCRRYLAERILNRDEEKGSSEENTNSSVVSQLRAILGDSSKRLEANAVLESFGYNNYFFNDKVAIPQNIDGTWGVFILPNFGNLGVYGDIIFDFSNITNLNKSICYHLIDTALTSLDISKKSIKFLEKLIFNESTFKNAMEILVNFKNAILKEQVVIAFFNKQRCRSDIEKLLKRINFNIILDSLIEQYSFLQYANRKNEDGILDTIFAKTWSNNLTSDVDVEPSEVVENLTIKSLQLLANSDNTDFSTLLTTLLMAGKKQTINAAVFHIKKIKEFLNS